MDQSQTDTPVETPENKGLYLQVDDTVRAIAESIHSFSDLTLHPRVLESVETVGWKEPTPVQKLCLPFTLKGRDVAGFAQTGTGKTGVFLITLANKLLAPQTEGEVQKRPKAIVLAPTRELAMQIEQDARPIFDALGISSLPVFGGIDYEKQARRLKEGVDVIFATPGRLKDYIQKNVITLEGVSAFVCDEADRMFDMGFIEDVEFFLKCIPETCQKLLFSATTNEQVKELAFEYLENPEYISVNPEVITPEKIEQHAIHCHATDKLRVMLGMLQDHSPTCAIVFTNTKLTAEWLHFKLVHNGIDADLITGDLPQNKRIRLIQRIKEGKLKALIATDVASRGLHISLVTHVYNFDLPDEPANYVHRIGRTARAGARGHAYSLVCDDYGQNLAAINEMLGTSAMRSEWYDERYKAIEDKAGNPFEERYRKKEARASEGTMRDKANGHGTRGKGERVQDERHGQKRRPNGRNKGRDDRRDLAPSPQANGSRPDGSRNQERHDARRNEQPRHGDGRKRHGKPRHHQNRRHEELQAAAAVKSQAATEIKTEEIAPKTLGGIVKKMFATLFGRRKS